MAKVYSTELGKLCAQCGEAEHEGRCANIVSAILGDGKVRIQRETKGRKGAGVTLVSGVPLAEKELKALHKKLKQKCGVGGSLKGVNIEIQGDQRDTIKAELERRGFTVKIAGG